ncbi:MAG: Lrp/AsnC family transcriptional regulator, regulator for asnA, asnC and gidA [Thermoleophilaceae bacterium]|jgi:Lrp/AsnC family transcriptional regulator for asnA, asnC and gidA|nr:Lrp/AsnC family transcriptional regulator, regulator for asnA, asnC and gidA [Thermoleophilaceae bacterium]
MGVMTPRSTRGRATKALPDNGDPQSPWLPEGLDGVDLAIVRRLQVNGRASLKSIADELGVSEGTVRKRLTRILDEEYIRIVAIPNALASAMTVTAMAHISIEGVDPEQVADEIADWPEVPWVAVGAGHIDLAVEIVAGGREGLRAVLQRIHAVEGVANLQTFVYLKVVKKLPALC